MRLIDADEFQKQIVGMVILNNYPPGKANALCKLVDSQPTAFDVEKVIHELQNLRMDIFEKVKKGYPTETIEDYFNCGEMVGKSDAYRDAIEIVKRGGRDGEK